MDWESVEKGKISLKDLWQMEPDRISFLLRATHDILPSPTNLHLWLGKDLASRLCDMQAAHPDGLQGEPLEGQLHLEEQIKC